MLDREPHPILVAQPPTEGILPLHRMTSRLGVEAMPGSPKRAGARSRSRRRTIAGPDLRSKRWTSPQGPSGSSRPPFRAWFTRRNGAPCEWACSPKNLRAERLKPWPPVWVETPDAEQPRTDLAFLIQAMLPAPCVRATGEQSVGHPPWGTSSPWGPAVRPSKIVERRGLIVCVLSVPGRGLRRP